MESRAFVFAICLTSCVLSFAQAAVSTPAHLVEVTADADSRFKMAGQNPPRISVKAGEPVLLRITARQGKSWNRDGSIHGFVLLRAKDRSIVPGWDFLLKTGTQEFQLTAPGEPGAYIVVCTVICSRDHDGMSMSFVVTP